MQCRWQSHVAQSPSRMMSWCTFIFVAMIAMTKLIICQRYQFYACFTHDEHVPCRSILFVFNMILGIQGFDFFNNIVYVADNTGYENLIRDSDYRGTVFDYNVYFTPNASLTLSFPDDSTWAQWRQTGNDTSSLIADPLFINVHEGLMRIILSPFL